MMHESVIEDLAGKKDLPVVHVFISLLLHAVVVAFLVLGASSFVHDVVAEKGDSHEQVIHAALLVADSAPATKMPVRKVLRQTPVPPAVHPVFLPDRNSRKQQILQALAKENYHRQARQKTQNAKKILQQAAAKKFAQQMKALNARALAAQLGQEKNRLDSLQEKKLQGVVDHYRALILQTVGAHWRVPGLFDRTLFADLLIRLAPGGTVLAVEIMKSSGNEGLDNSARMAVLHASPLPVPADPASFEAFRRFVLRVRPENIVTSQGG